MKFACKLNKSNDKVNDKAKKNSELAFGEWKKLLKVFVRLEKVEAVRVLMYDLDFVTELKARIKVIRTMS